jgi:5-methylcytosine-specific restriction endonuclease McrA
MSPRGSFYSSSAWRRASKRAIERAGGLCEIRGPKCTVVATETDHIIPISKGGSLLDPANLRACCKTDNLARVDHSDTPAKLIRRLNAMGLTDAARTVEREATEQALRDDQASQQPPTPSREW